MPAGGELGIRKDEVWAYKERWTGPLVPARVLNPGMHYDATITVLVLEGPTQGQRIHTRRNRLPCKWEDHEAWLERHPEIRREYPVEAEVADSFELPADMLFSMGEAALRRIVREELQAILNVPPKVAYNYKEAAKAVGISVTGLRHAVRGNYLTPHYYGVRPLFTPEELKRWVESLPDYYDHG